jgi:hypothetical protein
MAGKIVEALMSKAPPPDELDSEPDGDEAEPSGDDAEATAGAEFLDALGVPEEKREAAMAALKDFVRACAKGDDY